MILIPNIASDGDGPMDVSPIVEATTWEKLPFREANWNLDTPVLVEHVVKRGEGRIGRGGSILVETGAHTGRAPNDKYVVCSPGSHSRVWWDNNCPMTPAAFSKLRNCFADHVAKRNVYVQDLVACSASNSRLNARFVNSLAWHSLFIRQLLEVPSNGEEHAFVPDLTVVNCPELQLEPEEFGIRSRTVIAINLEQRLILIAGTRYAGENKKALFTFLNYSLPQRGILSMHCAANHAKGDSSDTALFFGLSGTGKTTLSADSGRALIGDDEHGWSDEGVFNIEAGCYAKTNNLSPTAEPDIYATTQMFGSVIENMKFDPATHKVDLQDTSLTENARCAYSLDRIPYRSRSGLAGHAKNIFLLTCDVFGVLPPIAKLTPAQAMYHFMSGFTSRAAGTESGTSGHQPVFSTCYGQPFLPCRPEVYGALLKQRISEHGSSCWLINTGWSKGPYGVGKRIDIAVTRQILSAALNGQLSGIPYRTDPTFGLSVPRMVPGVDEGILDPRQTWNDPLSYDARSAQLAALFADNFLQYQGRVDDDTLGSAIRAPQTFGNGNCGVQALS
ncbi:MAG: phosphoenolpyruvate carboxykinase (ATP) [Rhodobacteraceae bacterium]|nr:phosphoenolpyruvate carboxykinase (ATP) [Paracoccaceae bacterium]